jgi:Arc/MetJ-type ribon-helix-helix transcriptional regulator
MKSVQLDLPDQAASDLEQVVRAGWFRSEGELLQAALTEFVRRHWLELEEQFQRADIAWAVREKGPHT